MTVTGNEDASGPEVIRERTQWYRYLTCFDMTLYGLSLTARTVWPLPHIMIVYGEIKYACGRRAIGEMGMKVRRLLYLHTHSLAGTSNTLTGRSGVDVREVRMETEDGRRPVQPRQPFQTVALFPKCISFGHIL